MSGIIVAIGDMLRDIDQFCTVVKERDGYPCLKVERIEERAGGIGAVANMVQGLGVPVHTICDYGENFISTKTRTIVGGKVLQRIDKDVTARSFNCQLHYADIVLVADYGKGFLNEQLWEKIGDFYHDTEIIVDPHPSRPLSFYTGATAFKSAMGKTKLEVRSAKIPTIQTYGAAGLHFDPGNGSPSYHYCASAEDIKKSIDPCGAGDAVLAMLGVCRLQGMDWQESCQRAAEYAAKVCQVWGAKHPTELWDSLEKQAPSAASP